MGDRITCGDRKESAVTIITRGIRSLAAADEIFCQIAKQVTKNPIAQSTENGWELMGLCTALFSPSDRLYPWLCKFFSSHYTSHNTNVSTYAKFCLRKLKKTKLHGGFSMGVIPTVSQVQDMLAPAFRRSIFDMSLEHVMHHQSLLKDDCLLPRILCTLTDSILLCNGLTTEGIFRVPGSATEILSLKLSLEKGIFMFPSTITDPNVPASLLKQWLRELSEPVIPEEMYMECISRTEAEDRKWCVSFLHPEGGDGSGDGRVEGQNAFPEIHRRVLVHVVEFLRKFLQPHVIQHTRMTRENLALVFAPNLLRCPSEDLAVNLNAQHFQMRFLIFLLEDLPEE
eukprot:TRINITY_DN27401_c0_g1_i2.p1 TRINITY_DN27401_c0_g1~~TRINITY_DN27401_c0_g1_i2.p1  ORF type:complete len:341 (+),score=55.40 TRINITY_DN27401_c0_g1_i2:138-1160(+)